MKAIFVRNTRELKYADKLANHSKIAESRTRDTLSAVMWEEIAIIRTGSGKPMVIGYGFIGSKICVDKELFDEFFKDHCVPSGSKYDCPEDGFKWLYYFDYAFTCNPYPVPKNAVRHGRVWCEWEE